VTLAQVKSTFFAPDFNLMRRLNRWRAPRWFRWWMLLATRAGDGWLWGLIGIAVLLSPDAMRFRAIEAAACAVTCGIVLFHKVKRLVCRTRPRDIEPHCWAHIVTRDRFSFPSGHSTTAFAVAITLGSFYPRSCRCCWYWRRMSRSRGWWWDAFSERRAGWFRHGRAAGLRRFPVRGVGNGGRHSSRRRDAGTCLRSSGVFRKGVPWELLYSLEPEGFWVTRVISCPSM